MWWRDGINLHELNKPTLGTKYTCKAASGGPWTLHSLPPFRGVPCLACNPHAVSTVSRTQCQPARSAVARERGAARPRARAHQKRHSTTDHIFSKMCFYFVEGLNKPARRRPAARGRSTRWTPSAASRASRAGGCAPLGSAGFSVETVSEKCVCVCVCARERGGAARLGALRLRACARDCQREVRVRERERGRDGVI